MVKCFDSPFGSYFVPESQLVVDMVTRYLAVINSSSNFIIYCVAGKQFRTVLAILLNLRPGRSVNNLAAVKIHHKKQIQYFPLHNLVTFGPPLKWANTCQWLQPPPLCISSQRLKSISSELMNPVIQEDMLTFQSLYPKLLLDVGEGGCLNLCVWLES